MKSKFFYILLFFFYFTQTFAENINIQAKNISIDKNREVSIFENEVKVITNNGITIKSDYAEFNKKLNFLTLKNNITAIDKNQNEISAEYAEFNTKTKIFKTKGFTKVFTPHSYYIESEDIYFDNNSEIKEIKSDKSTLITDKDKNEIILQNFNYETKFNVFKSIGSIKIKDKLNNTYEFSQIYIDAKKEILGTDAKAFMNHQSFKINEKNKPRIFSNTLTSDRNRSSFKKSVFTLCDYRENDKCPPWTIQASEMLHDNKKKTIFYDNAIVKVYNIPVFYLPKLSHPDPSVERRSGFLPPSFSDSKNLGSGVTVPYFWALNDDKNLTFTNKFYVTENPLFLGEYHQAFKSSNFLADFGFTEGYKNNSSKKRAGDKSHFFAKLIKNFDSDKSKQSLNLSIQNVSDDKYLKLYKINSNLVDYNTSTLENTIDYTIEDEEYFLGINSSVYETINDSYNDKYEYVLPEITFDKNIISNEKIGSLDLQTNYKVRKYDTNKFTNFLVNDFLWNYKEINHSSGFTSKILASIKNINYEAKNVDIYKKDTTTEVLGAIGYLTELDLIKEVSGSKHFLTPKFLLRFAPGSMRKETDGSKLDVINAFSMNRVDNNYNFESGFSGTVGFDYKIKKGEKDLDFSVAQIINEKENKKMASKTSMDEKISDLVGSASYKISEKIKLNYNFNVDQNYQEINYNEFGSSIILTQ